MFFQVRDDNICSSRYSKQKRSFFKEGIFQKQKFHNMGWDLLQRQYTYIGGIVVVFLFSLKLTRKIFFNSLLFITFLKFLTVILYGFFVCFCKNSHLEKILFTGGQQWQHNFFSAAALFFSYYIIFNVNKYVIAEFVYIVA